MRKAISLSSLEVGKSLGKDIFDSKEVLLLKAGTILIPELKEALLQKGLKEVYVLEEEPERWGAPQKAAQATQPEKSGQDFAKFLKLTNKLIFEIKRTQLRGQYKLIIQKELASTLAEMFKFVFLHDEMALKYLLDFKQTNPDYCYEKHAFATGLLAGLLARWFNLDIQSIIETAVTGCLHDIGEIHVPREILEKKGKPSLQEWREIKKHPITGAVIVNKTKWISPRIVLGVLRHHERLDGTGYPEGCSGKRIPLYSRITAVASSFNAMTTNRPYASAVDIFDAITELRDRSYGQLDPRITRMLCNKILGHYRDNKVELTNGDTGVIVCLEAARQKISLIKSARGYYDLMRKNTPRIKKVLAK